MAEKEKKKILEVEGLFKKEKKIDDDLDQLPVLTGDADETALEKARRNGRIRGWLEGGGSVVGVLVILSFWKIFAVIAGVGVVGYGGYWYMKRKKANADPDAAA